MLVPKQKSNFNKIEKQRIFSNKRVVDCDTEQETDLKHSMLFTEEIWKTTDEEEQKRRK